MQKHKILITSLFALSSATLLAGHQAQQTPPQPEKFSTQPQGVITPAVAPRVNNGAEVILTGDFIWWKPHIGGTEYAVTGVNDKGTNVANFTNVSKGKTHQPDYDFKPGFKVGLGLDFAHDGWDLYAEYTWLQPGRSEKDSFTAKAGQGASTVLNVVDGLGNQETLSIASGSAKWKQHFNVIDLMLGRNFFISRYLTLRPSIGLKSAWIRERLNMSYTTTAAQTATTDHAISAKQRRRQNLWGIGTRFGLDGVWHFSKNWGIYGDVAATALWSDFHVSSKDSTVALNTGVHVPSTNLNTRETLLEVMAVLEGSIGLTYMTWFHHDKYQFVCKAGWEEQVWVNFNHFMQPGVNGDLTLQGLTVKVGFAF